MARTTEDKTGWASELVRWLWLALGWVLIVCAPLVSPLPGPGGILLFGLGASLVLKNSRWAKRAYARFKKRHPRKGRWADWSLRRASHRRREALARERAALSD